jgi:hypothetical protein
LGTPKKIKNNNSCHVLVTLQYGAIIKGEKLQVYLVVTVVHALVEIVDGDGL